MTIAADFVSVDRPLTGGLNLTFAGVIEWVIDRHDETSSALEGEFLAGTERDAVEVIDVGDPRESFV